MRYVAFPLAAAISIASLVNVKPALARPNEAQFWTGLSAVARPSERDIVIMTIGQRFRPMESGDQQVAYAIVEHRLSDLFQIGTLAYYRSDPERELRLYEQLTLSLGALSSRTRLEERYLSTASEISWRLRHRTRVAVPLDQAKRWTLIGMQEFYFNLNRARPIDVVGLAVFRHFAGGSYALSKALNVQLLYIRQKTMRADGADLRDTSLG